MSRMSTTRPVAEAAGQTLRSAPRTSDGETRSVMDDFLDLPPDLQEALLAMIRLIGAAPKGVEWDESITDQFRTANTLQEPDDIEKSIRDFKSMHERRFRPATQMQEA